LINFLLLLLKSILLRIFVSD